MKKYRLFLEILTPVHIGDGSYLEPYEYVIDEKFHKINLMGFLLALPIDKQNESNNLLQSDIMKFREFLKKNYKGKDCVISSSKISEDLKLFYEHKIDDPRNKLIIAPFVRNGFQTPYIPGSSIKGALRTAIIFNFFPARYLKETDKLKALKSGYRSIGFNKEPGLLLPQEIKPQEDPFRSIKISDITFPDDSNIIQRIKTVTKKDGKIETLNISLIKETTCADLIGKDLNLEAELMYDDQLLKQNKDFKKKIIVQDIIDSNKFFSEKMISFEQSYFIDHPVYETYNTLKAIWSTLKENEFMFRLGWGCGYNSMTINLKMYKPRIIKTRKLINDKIPLGWIKGRMELKE